MRVRVLGEVDVRGDDGEPIAIRQRKLRELVCVLALEDGSLTSGQLQTLLWVQAETRDMMSALTTTMMRLRKRLPEDRLVRDGDGYRLVLDAERDYLDVREFRELVTAARGVREADPETAAELLGEAVGLWRDVALPGLPATLAMDGRRQRLRIEHRDAIEALAEVQLALGRHAVVARQIHGWLADDPLNDRLWLSLLLAQYRDGRKGDALRTFDDARGMYLTELGAEPSVPLVTMRDRIAANDPGLDWEPTHTVQESRAISAGIDITRPSVARWYDYMIGGDNNFEIDRRLAREGLAAIPDLREGPVRNRAFLRWAVRFLAERGIRQFLDVGAGLPSRPNVHEVAREIDPDARVVYVDYDPFVVAHGRAMIEDSRNTAYILGDVRHPSEIFSDPQTLRLIDPREPVGVLMLAVAHFVPADEIHLCQEQYRAWMAPGSALVISHVTRDGSNPETVKMSQDTAARTEAGRVFIRSRAEIESLFTGLELVAPLADPGSWQADEVLPPCSLALLSGIAFRT
jgi:DNA-binding SARP family transcriptional activator